MARSNKKKLSRKRTTSKSKKPHKLTKKQKTRLKQPKKTKTRKSKRKTRKLKRKSRKLKGGIEQKDGESLEFYKEDFFEFLEPDESKMNIFIQEYSRDNGISLYIYFLYNENKYLMRFDVLNENSNTKFTDYYLYNYKYNRLIEESDFDINTELTFDSFKNQFNQSVFKRKVVDEYNNTNTNTNVINIDLIKDLLENFFADFNIK